MLPTDPRPDDLPDDPAAKRLRVVSAANDAYFPGLAVTFHSLLEHLAAGWTVDFAVLTDGLQAERHHGLAEVLRSTGRVHTLEILDIDLRAYADYPALAGSKLAYARLLIPGLFAAERQALYVDCDMVVLKDVSRVAALPWTAGKVLHAVRDSKIPTVSMDWESLPFTDLGIPSTAPYFNTGFLWMNLAEWRRQGVDEACRAYVSRFPDRVRWHDQSVLNAVLWDRWSPLDRTWNLPSELTLGTFALYPVVGKKDVNVHYTGRQKPWSKMHPLEHFYQQAAAKFAHRLPGERLLRKKEPRERLHHLHFFARRAYWHYGGLCKRVLRGPRRQKLAASHHTV